MSLVDEMARAVDRYVDALDQIELGDEYAPGASMPWLVARRQWELYVTLVELIDRAVHDPFAEGATALLLTSTALHNDDVFQLAHALAHAGEAIRRARSTRDAEAGHDEA